MLMKFFFIYKYIIVENIPATPTQIDTVAQYINVYHNDLTKSYEIPFIILIFIHKIKKPAPIDLKNAFMTFVLSLPILNANVFKVLSIKSIPAALLMEPEPVKPLLLHSLTLNPHLHP